MTHQHPLHPEPADPDELTPEISALYDAQEAILDAAEAAGRSDLRKALSDLFLADDLGLLSIAHGSFAAWARKVRETVGRAGDALKKEKS